MLSAVFKKKIHPPSTWECTRNSIVCRWQGLQQLVAASFAVGRVYSSLRVDTKCIYIQLILFDIPSPSLHSRNSKCRGRIAGSPSPLTAVHALNVVREKGSALCSLVHSRRSVLARARRVWHSVTSSPKLNSNVDTNNRTHDAIRSILTSGPSWRPTFVQRRVARPTHASADRNAPRSLRASPTLSLMGGLPVHALGHLPLEARVHCQLRPVRLEKVLPG